MGHALTSSTRLSVDYQFINNPGYNGDRGPVNVFVGSRTLAVLGYAQRCLQLLPPGVAERETQGALLWP